MRHRDPYRIGHPTMLWALVVSVLGPSGHSMGQSACQQAHVTASDGGVFDSFGRAVAVSGETALIGAFWDDDNGLDSGSAYIFRPDGGRWVQTQKLLSSDGIGVNWFGFAVAIEGDTAMISALQHIHDGAPGTGAVYVFRYNGSSWIETQELLASKGTWGDAFGTSVSISGDVAVIGAEFDDDNGPQSGSAYVFRFDGTNWVEEQKLLPSDGAAADFFGGSVALCGEIAVIGARMHVNDGLTLGSAYVFRFNGSTWVEEQELLPSKDAGSAAFGSSVSISDDAILIGARGEGPGSAYVFRFDPAGEPGSQWVPEQKLLASDPGGPDQFGRSVAIDGAPGNEIAVVGAFASNASSGAAYIYRFDSDASQWTEQAQLLPDPNPWTNFFGYSVAIDGETAVIGAHGEDQQRGAAYVFDLALNCNCPHDLDANGSVGVSDLLALLGSWGPCKDCPADFDENGSVGVSDLLVLLANWGPCP